MKHAGEEAAEGAKTVRFTAVVAEAGKPALYLPLFDPKQDRAFMRAVKEQRVLSIHQDPTSQRSDFGVVGFDERKHTTLLVFPKSLRAFTDARVIGIKYDVVGESHFAHGAPPRSLKLPKARVEKTSHEAAKTHEPRPAEPAKEKPAEPPKRAEPKQFRVRVRLTIVKEKEITVSAMTKTEAKQRARAAVAGEGDAKALCVTEA